MKRSDYINWDEYFMGIALLTAYPEPAGSRHCRRTRG